METWPNRVREWRKRRGLSQKALAAELKCHHTFVGRIERGDRRLTDAMISQLARILKVSANDIIKADDQVATEESIARLSGLLRTMTLQEQEMVLNVAETVASRGSKRAS